MTRFETMPQAWDTERDAAFFTITARLFDAAFVAGAGVLLASYDDENPVVEAVPVTALPAPRRRHCAGSWV